MSIIAFLHEVGSNASQVSISGSTTNWFNLIFPGTNLAASVVNAVITGKGLADVNQRLGGIKQQTGNIQRELQGRAQVSCGSPFQQRSPLRDGSSGASLILE